MNICVDAAGGRAGLGHLKRCLSIAQELKRLGHDVEFCSGDSDHNYLIRESEFAAKSAGAKYDMIIIDRYGVNNGMLAAYRKRCSLLVRMDDASPQLFRDRISDVIINGNAYASKELYGSIARDDLHLLAGGQYVPMDVRMCLARSRYRVRKKVKNIAVTFGGADRDYTLRVCRKIASLDLDAHITVLNGARLDGQLGRLSRVELLPFVNNMHEILLKSDVIICSSSSTCWQAAAVGVSCITFQTADNQRRVFEYIKKARIGVALTDDNALEKAIRQLDYARRKKFSVAARKIVDCRGSQRIAAYLHRLLVA